MEDEELLWELKISGGLPGVFSNPPPLNMSNISPTPPAPEAGFAALPAGAISNPPRKFTSAETEAAGGPCAKERGVKEDSKENQE